MTTTTCPACNSPDVHRSHVRSPWETLRRLVTRRRPYRCHRCRWRGWAGEDAFPHSPGEPAVRQPARHADHESPLELDALDRLDFSTNR